MKSYKYIGKREMRYMDVTGRSYIVNTGDIIELKGTPDNKLFSENIEKIIENELSNKNKSRLKEIEEDLLDDGKLNYSNNPNKGRKLKGE